MPITGTSPAIHVPAAGGGAISHGALITNYSAGAPMETWTHGGGGTDVPVGDVKFDTDHYWSSPNNSFYALTIPTGLGGLYLLSAGGCLTVKSTAPTSGSASCSLYSSEIGDLMSATCSWEFFTPSNVTGWEFGVSVVAWLSAGYYVEWFGSNYMNQDMYLNGTSTQFISAILLHQ